MSSDTKNETTGTKHKPLKVIRRGAIAASIWRRKSPTGFVYLDFTLSRSWKLKNGETFNGAVLVAGGRNGSGFLSSAELFSGLVTLTLEAAAQGTITSDTNSREEVFYLILRCPTLTLAGRNKDGSRIQDSWIR